MALSTPTQLVTTPSTANNDFVTSGTISPTANALLIVAVAGAESPDATHDTMTDTLTGTGIWTRHQTDVFDDGSRPCRISIWTAQAGPSPGSGTITLTFGSTCRRKVIGVAEITGHDTTTPVAQSKSSNGNASTLTVTLDSTPAATSAVIGAIAVKEDSDGVSPGSGFTELTDVDSGGPAFQARLQMQYDLTGADTTCDWSALSTLANAGAAIEIAEAGGAVVNFSAAAIGASASPDNASVAVLRNMTSALSAASQTPDVASLAVLRSMSAASLAASATPDTASLAVLRPLAAIMQVASATPDTVSIQIIKSFVAVLLASSVTPDVASLTVIRALAAAIQAVSTTPDTGSLVVMRLMLATLLAASLTPDDVVLDSGAVERLIQMKIPVRSAQIPVHYLQL